MPEGYNLGTAYGKVVISADGVRTAMDQARTIFSGGIQAIGGHIRSLGDQMSSIGSNLTVLTAPITAFGVAGVKAAMDFDSALKEIEVRTGATTEAMESVRQKSLDIGRDTSFSAGQAASAFLQLLTTGQSLEEAMATIDSVMAGAAASGADLGFVADALTDIMASFGLEASQAGETMDALSQASGVSSATMVDLIAGFQNVGGVARQFGLSVADTSAALATLSENGIKGSEAGTALRSMLNNMTRDTEDVTTVWKRLGLSMFDTMGNARPLADVMNELGEKLALMSDEARIDVLKTLGGTYGQLALAALTTGEGMDDMKAKMAGAATATEVAEGRMNTFKGSLLFVKGSLETLQIKVLTPFMNNTLKPLVQRIGEVINAVSNWVDANPELAETITKVVAGVTALGPALFVGGKFVSAFGGLISSLGAILGLLLSPVGLVVAGVAALGYAFHTNFMGMRDVLEPVIQAIGTGLQMLMGLLTGRNTALMRSVGGMFEDNPLMVFIWRLREKIVEALGLVKTAIRDGIDGIKLIITGDFKRGMFGGGSEDTQIAGFFLGIHRAIENVWSNLQDLWDKHLKPLFSEIGEFLGTVFQNIDMEQVLSFASALWSLASPIGRIQAIFKALGIDIGQVLRDIIDGITRFFETLNSGGGIGEAIGAALGGGDLGEGVGGFLGGMIDTIQNVVVPGIQGFVTWLTGEALPTVGSFIQNDIMPIINTFISGLSGLWDQVAPALTNLWNWFTSEGLPAIGNLVSSVWNDILQPAFQFIADVWNMVAPALGAVAGWFLSDGLPLIQDIITTVYENVILPAFNFLRDVWTIIQPALQNLFDWFVSTGWPAISQFIEDAWNNVIKPAFEFIGNVWNAVSPALLSLFDWFITTGWPFISQIISDVWNNVIAPVINGLSTLWNVISPALSSVFDWFVTTGFPLIQGAVQLFLDNVLTPLINILSTIWDVISAPLELLKGGIEGVFSFLTGIVQGFIDLVNGIVGIIENVVNSIDKLPQEFVTGRDVREDYGGYLKDRAAQGHDFPGMGRAGQPYSIGVPEMFAMANGGQILFVPPNNGQFTPMDQMAGGGGDSFSFGDINITMPVEALNDRATAEQRGSEFGAAFMEELRRRGMK